MKVTHFLSLSATICLLAGATAAQAQSWPQRPIRFVVPFAAGGSTDSIARITAERLSVALGQPVVLENKPGASGLIAVQTVQRAPSDGYTLLVAAMPVIVILPKISPVPFDPLKDFVPITNFATNPFLLAVSKNVPVNTVKELVDYAKPQAGKLNFASGGSGSVSHLSGALFVKRAELDMMHISYKGDVPAVAAMIAGDVTMYFGNVPVLAPQAKAGNIKLLGVTSDKRLPELPEVPTIAETFPGFRTLTWNGLMAPAGTPTAIVDRIAMEVKKIAADPTYQERMKQLGVQIVADTPDEFRKAISADIDLFADAIRSANLKVQ
ncbi:Bug family tripartite tricarboxylate transporter substrate binding protein [Pigmentiphaga litoralis]|uniref:Bug family tripartite tricarboxylate transporter substrate binding protein n=1 Tax=Pigmentiphaga litoralis TaxID=516702 RepID=UPI003B43038B